MSKNKAKSHSHDLWQFRNTVEGIYIAIVLAFVLRAFMVEAFVIPTGSMANALYGEHYRLSCPACGYEYAYGYFPGDNDTGQRGVSVPLGKPRAPRNAVCPNCGYSYAADESIAEKVRGSGGDRVVVMKYLYEFAGPKPWDVVVFKNPQNNRENYIKRLIGLPGETLEIVLGDIFVKEKGQKEFRIRRKPDYAQSNMWLVVYDNDFMPYGTPANYINKAPQWEFLAGKSGGAEICKTRRFAFDGDGMYRFSPGLKNPELGYFRPVNGYNPPQAEQMTISSQLDVSTDWKLSAVIFDESFASGKAEFHFELRERKYRATFDLSGKVELAMGLRGDENAGKWLTTRTAEHSFEPGKGSQVELRHVDMMTSLWVGGKEILSIDDTVATKTPEGKTVTPCGYETARHWAYLPELLRSASAEVAELQAKNNPETLKVQVAQAKLDNLKRQWEWYQNPSISIVGSGGKFSLAHVKIMRDVYYTSPHISTPRDDNANYDYVRKILEHGGGPNSWKRDDDGNFLAWGVTGNPITLRKFPDSPERDEFYCLGDNSPQSHDCRTWIAAAPTLKLMDKNGEFSYQLGTVPRYNIIGRAFFVFWPAGFNLPVLEMPIVPNAGRMRFIR